MSPTLDFLFIRGRVVVKTLAMFTMLNMETEVSPIKFEPGV